MKKYLTIVGTRPQIIKLDKDFKQTLVYVGQHYDKNLKDKFFTGLHLKKPDYDLGKTELGSMIDAIINVIKKEKPDYVIVYGDCRSTLAGAVAAYYENIPVIHIEAGCRCGNMKMIEERIRILVDEIASVHFTPSELTKKRLEENYNIAVFNVGATQLDTMFSTFPTKKPKDAYKYQVLTIHRDFNATVERLKAITDGLSHSKHIIRFYAHPRLQGLLKGLKLPKNIKILKPIPYKKMINEIAFAEKVITDSGGLQVEAFFLRRPCLTLRDETEWEETVDSGWNKLVGADTVLIKRWINETWRGRADMEVYGKGEAKKKIRLLLENL